MDLRLDHLRRERTGLAEAVYAPGKSPAQCAEAVAGLLAGPGSGPVLLTRANAEQAAAATALSPGAVTATAGADESGLPLSTLTWGTLPATGRTALVLTAGTSDLPVAREAAAVLAAYGHELGRGRRRRRRRPAPGARAAGPRSRRPTWCWWSPAWRARWPASSPA